MPKLAAAIMTGTMASPSRPSVRFTALPAPTMMKIAKITKNQPRLITSSLKNGNTSEVENGARPNSHKTRCRRRAAMHGFDRRAAPARRIRYGSAW